MKQKFKIGDSVMWIGDEQKGKSFRNKNREMQGYARILKDLHINLFIKTHISNTLIIARTWNGLLG